jgi:hypothetical protein
MMSLQAAFISDRRRVPVSAAERGDCFLTGCFAIAKNARSDMKTMEKREKWGKFKR